MNYSSFVQLIASFSYSTLNDPLRLSISLLTSLTIIILLLYALILSIRKGEKLKYEFITIITHKFRTPLSQIKWTLDEIIPSEQEPYVRESMQNVQKSNEKLIQLTTTLIELANSTGNAKSSYHFEQINLCQLVYNYGDALKKVFQEKNLYFSVQATEEEIFVRADRSRLEFVVQTIMENAITYSPSGRNVEIIVSRAGRKALVSVTDHGIGMDRLDTKRLFTKFFRAKNARAMDTEGFGVSLYLAQSVMQHHHGKIEVFSEGLNKGSTFIISLPIATKK